MVMLKRGTDGAYRARKRIPDALRSDYGKLYGRSFEEKFFAPSTTPFPIARQLFGEWLAQVEGQITALRAQRAGEGITLAPRQAAGLAGEWYDWFLARHPLSDEEQWEELRDKIQSALKDASGDEDWEAERGHVWKSPAVRDAVRPLLADVGETAQFLGMRGIALDRNSRTLFLDQLYLTLSQALQRLLQLSRSDYSPDKYRERLPKFELGATDTGITPWALFEKWVAERKPAASTVESWRYPFREMQTRFDGRGAASITPEEAQAWVQSLITAVRSARSVKDNWLAAAKAVFVWGVDHKHVPRNPFAGVKVTVPKRKKTRESPAFETHEYRPILKASLAVTDTRAPDDAALRWVPWLGKSCHSDHHFRESRSRPPMFPPIRAFSYSPRNGAAGAG